MWMIGKPTDDSLLKLTLEIECRLVAFDPGLDETFQDRADVLVLVFDRTATSADELLECAIALRLIERLPCKLHRKHGEIIRDNRVILAVLPIARRHHASLTAFARSASRHAIDARLRHLTAGAGK